MSKSKGWLQKLFRMQSSVTMSSMMRTKEPPPRDHWVIFSRGQIELNPARNLCHQYQVWLKLHPALGLLLLMIFQLHHLPPPLAPPVNNSSCLVTRCQPLGTSCCTALLNFSRYCAIRLNVFSLFLCVCSLCIICIKSVITPLQYSTIEPTVVVGFLG